MPSRLKDRRCFNHELRESVARCCECHSHFCRECIVEHDDLIYCGKCIGEQLQASTDKQKLAGKGKALFTFGFGFMLIVVFFYLIALSLFNIPSSIHEGSIWKSLR